VILLFIGQRILYAIPVLLVVSFIVFGIFQWIPGTFCEEGLTGQRRRICNELRERFAMNQAFHIQYVKWLENIVTRGDFGPSFAPPYNPAIQVVVADERLVNTLLIAGLAFVLALLIATPTALYSAMRPDSWGDRIFSFVSVLGLSIPNFFIGLLIMELLVVWLQVGNRWNLPIGLGLPHLSQSFSNFDGFLKFVWQLWPVVIIAATGLIGETYRQMRGALLEICGDPSWRAAERQARTFKERRALYVEALGRGFESLLSWFGLWLFFMFEGTMIASTVLNVQTVELVIWNSVRSQNVYVAIAGLMIFAVILIVSNILVDIYLMLGGSQRIRYD
jgi:peptide/nickel transport system permease protein